MLLPDEYSGSLALGFMYIISSSAHIKIFLKTANTTALTAISVILQNTAADKIIKFRIVMNFCTSGLCVQSIL
jgi:hypothetical protein